MLIYERPTARFSWRGLVGGILMGVQLYTMSFQVVKVRRSAYLEFPLFVDLTQRKVIRLNTIACKLVYDNKPFFRSACNWMSEDQQYNDKFLNEVRIHLI